MAPRLVRFALGVNTGAAVRGDAALRDHFEQPPIVSRTQHFAEELGKPLAAEHRSKMLFAR
jgi:hypothetical protein